MKPYMDKGVAVKKQYTPTKNTTGRRKYVGCKVLLNSAYGKLAEKPHDDTVEYDEEMQAYMKVEDYEYRSLYPGMYVTTKSRIKLISTIKELVDRGNTFLYCDTDSVLIGLTGDYKFMKVHSTNLGEWDLEKIFNRFVYNGKRKKYCLEYVPESTDEQLEEFLTWYKSVSDQSPEQINKALPDLMKRKGTTSGFPTSIYNDLENWDDIKHLYDPKICVVVKEGKKTSLEDSYTFKKRFDVVDSLFNSDGEKDGSYLEKIDGRWVLIKVPTS